MRSATVADGESLQINLLKLCAPLFPEALTAKIYSACFIIVGSGDIEITKSYTPKATHWII